ncbi:MAG: ABC transporter substrate-binding protein [Peptostreptococcaceae bacterium]
MNKINLKLIRINPLTLPVFIAKEKGIFKKNGIDINLRVDENFVFDGNQPFIDGEVDAMMGDITFFFYILEKGKDAVVTSNLTRTIQLVGKNYPKDLKKLKIGANRTGLLRIYLENDLKELLPDAEIVWINNSYERLEALDKGKIHALVAIEPFISDVVEKGGEVIWSSKNSDKNMVMWAFDKEFYMNNKDVVEAFHNSLEESQNLFNSLKEDEKVKIAIECGKYDTNLAERMRNFEFEKQDNFSNEDFELCQEWMIRENEIKNKYDSKLCLGDIF